MPFEEAVEPLGFSLPLDREGNRLKNPFGVDEFEWIHPQVAGAGHFLMGIAKALIPPRLRHLARTELNMLRDDGVRKAASYNWMLTDAWARNLVNRRRYPQLDQESASRLRRSETVFVFGSGYSLNDITADEWRRIAAHDTFGFNAFYHQRWIT